MRLQKLPFFLLLLVLPFLLVDCKKPKPTPPPVQEENLVISIDPDPGTTAVTKVLQNTYNVQLTIQSKMPPQGVSINVQYRKDADNAVLFSQTLETTEPQRTITINNINTTDVGTVTITVTSKTKATNVASKSFKLARK